MKPTFTLEEVLPLVARLITTAPSDAGGFVDHESIVAAILTDSEGAKMVYRARKIRPERSEHTVAANMVAWFSQQITVDASPWGEFLERKKKAGRWAYRPKIAESPINLQDSDKSAIEGDARMFFHMRRERNPLLAKAKREAVIAAVGHLKCEACGFTTQSIFNGLSGEVCEVHHRNPLSNAVNSVETKLSDLSILCANCHRAIHKTKPLMSVEEFSNTYFPRNTARSD